MVVPERIQQFAGTKLNADGPDDSGAKEIVARSIAKIEFAAVETGFLHDGGRSQQPRNCCS
jgi:hypothetical protein